MAATHPDEQKTAKITETIRRLLDKLDEQEQNSPKNRRAQPRVRYRRMDVRIQVTHPGGGTSDHIVPTRNLSSGGIGILYGGFLYPGTSCRVTLPRRGGGEEQVRGAVTFCKHVVGAFHSVGIKFHQKLFARQFIDPAHWGELTPEAATKPSDLSGRVLLVEDREMDRMLFTHYLKETALEVSAVATAAQAVEKVKGEAFDLVMCDLNLEEATGEQAITLLRQAGYAGMVIALRAEGAPDRLAPAQAAGAGAIISKPYDREKLLLLLAGWLKSESTEATEDPVYSDLADQPGMEPLIEHFVISVHAAAAELRKAAGANNFDAVRVHCQNLKGSGSGFGFPLLSQLAKDAVDSLDSCKSVADARAEIQSLESVCRRLSSSLRWK